MLARASINHSTPATREDAPPNCSIRQSGYNSIDRICSPRQIEAEQTIFLEGEIADDLFEIKDGVVRIYKMLKDGRRQITGFIYPGQIIGLAFRGRHICTAEAITNTIVLRYARVALEKVVQTESSVGNRLLRLTINELVAAQDQMLLLGRKHASEKIASFLLRLSEHNKEAGLDRHILYLPMLRRDIGDYLGLTVETVSRMLTKCKKEGVIRCVQSDRIEIVDMDGLLELAEGDEACM